MAIITLDKKVVKKLIKGSDENIEATLGMFGTAVERITKESVEVEVAPDRPDMLSQQGVIRALTSWLGKKSKKTYKVKKSGIKLKVKPLKQWPYVVTAVVKGLSFNNEKIKEIIDIQEKIGETLLRKRKKGGIGIYPLEKITPPIIFYAEKPEKIKFRPLEYSREITGRQILSKHPTGREYAHICQSWDKFPIFKDSKGIIMSMPPIINSHDVGKIDKKTRDVFIEATGTDVHILNKVLNIIVIALADIGGKIYSIDMNYPNKTITTPDLSQEKMKINLKDANNLLGLKLTEKQVKNLLTKMGYSYKSKTVHIPAYRTDILHPVDVYEDLAIAYGYNKFQPEIPEISTIGKENEKEIFKRKIAEIITGLNILETSSYHLTTKQIQFKNMNTKALQSIELENSKTEFNVLRENLLSNQLKILSENLDSEYPQNIFEIGTVFEPDLQEKTNLCITKTPGDFTQIKQILQYLQDMLNIKLNIQETTHPSFIQGRVGKISYKNKEIGIIGEIHPQVLKNWHLKMPVSSLEICIDNLR